MLDFMRNENGSFSVCVYDEFLVAALCEDVINIFSNEKHPSYIDPVLYAEGNKAAAEKTFNALPGVLSWADHGFFNVAYSKVMFLYGYSKMLAVSNTQMRNLPISLLARALSAAQSWKNTMISKEKEIYGEHWGTSTRFNNDVLTIYLPAVTATGPVPVDALCIDPGTQTVYIISVPPIDSYIKERLGCADVTATRVGDHVVYSPDGAPEFSFRLHDMRFYGTSLLVPTSGLNNAIVTAEFVSTVEKSVTWEPERLVVSA